MIRTYVCPACGFDGFKITGLRGTVDFNLRVGCPVCLSRGLTVWLDETSDPRDEEPVA